MNTEEKAFISATDVFSAIREIGETDGIVLAHHATLSSLDQYRPAYRLAQTYLPSGASILDWGTGNGHFSLFCALAGYDVHAFSIFEKPIYRQFINAIERRFCDKFQYFLGNPETHAMSLPYDSRTFDGAFSIGVLEHVREFNGMESASLRELHRVLKPGGYLIVVAFPNAYSWVEALRGGHRFKYTKADIKKLAASSEFELVRQERYQFLPRVYLNKIPKKISNNKSFAVLYNKIDNATSMLLNVFCTNHAFVLRKPTQ